MKRKKRFLRTVHDTNEKGKEKRRESISAKVRMPTLDSFKNLATGLNTSLLDGLKSWRDLSAASPRLLVPEPPVGVKKPFRPAAYRGTRTALGSSVLVGRLRVSHKSFRSVRFRSVSPWLRTHGWLLSMVRNQVDPL